MCCRVQLLFERHEFDVITKWTISADSTVFAFSRDDGVIVYLVSPEVKAACAQAFASAIDAEKNKPRAGHADKHTDFESVCLH